MWSSEIIHKIIHIHQISAGWGPPVMVCWFITSSKYSYLRIIHQLVIIVICTNLAIPNWKPHPEISWDFPEISVPFGARATNRMGSQSTVVAASPGKASALPPSPLETRRAKAMKGTYGAFIQMMSCFSVCNIWIHMAVCQNLVPLVNIKIAGKWMFIPLKNGINRYWPIPIWWGVCFFWKSELEDDNTWWTADWGIQRGWKS